MTTQAPTVGTLVRILDSAYGNPSHPGVYTVVRVCDSGRSFDLVRGNVPEAEAALLGADGDYDFNMTRARLVPALTTV